LVVYPGRKSFWDHLMGINDSAGADTRSPEQWLLREAGADSTIRPLLDGGMLRLMPYRLELR
jgi:hypothetical protein